MSGKHQCWQMFGVKTNISIFLSLEVVDRVARHDFKCIVKTIISICHIHTRITLIT